MTSHIKLIIGQYCTTIARPRLRSPLTDFMHIQRFDDEESSSILNRSPAVFRCIGIFDPIRKTLLCEPSLFEEGSARSLHIHATL